MIGNLGRRWGSDGGGGEAVELARRQWEAVREFIPDSLRRADGRGRLWRDNRAALEGIVWVLHSGARWEELPERFPRSDSPSALPTLGEVRSNAPGVVGARPGPA